MAKVHEMGGKEDKCLKSWNGNDIQSDVFALKCKTMFSNYYTYKDKTTNHFPSNDNALFKVL